MGPTSSASASTSTWLCPGSCSGSLDRLRQDRYSEYSRRSSMCGDASLKLSLGIPAITCNLNYSGLWYGDDELASPLPVGLLLPQDLIRKIPGQQQDVVRHVFQ